MHRCALGILGLTKAIKGWDELPATMKPQQVQKTIQISRATFCRLVASGNLPGAKKVGDSWRISRDQLRAYFEGQRSGGSGFLSGDDGESGYRDEG